MRSVSAFCAFYLRLLCAYSMRSVCAFCVRILCVLCANSVHSVCVFYAFCVRILCVLSAHSVSSVYVFYMHILCILVHYIDYYNLGRPLAALGGLKRAWRALEGPAGFVKNPDQPGPDQNSDRRRLARTKAQPTNKAI